MTDTKTTTKPARPELPKSKLTKRQARDYGPKVYKGEHGERLKITAHVRYDDQCGNGHNTFAITATIVEANRYGRWVDYAGGCCHEEIAEHFPELAPLLKWHLMNSDGPTHYPGNVTYHASNRDHWGLLKGEEQQIRNGRTGKLCWRLERDDRDSDDKLPTSIDADEQPTGTVTMRYVPWTRTGEGKERNFDGARSCACDPTLTDEQLMLDKPELEALLMDRLPALVQAFKSDVEALGFEF